MALLMAQGFEEYADAEDLQRAIYAADFAAIVAGRDFGQALNVTSIDSVFIGFGPEITDTIFCSFDYQVSSVSAYDMMRLGNAGDDDYFEMELVAGGEISVNQGTTELGVTSGAGITGATWHHIQVKLVISATVGEVELRVDGNVELTLTNQDTVGVGTGVSRVQLFARGTADTYFDNLVVWDDTGTILNDFPTDRLVVETLWPNGDGTTNDFTPLSGLTNYQMIDDGSTPDDDTTYVSSSTLNAVDLYTMENISQSLGAIVGVGVFVLARLNEVKARQLRALTRSGVTNYESSPFYLSPGSYAYWTRYWEADPDTAVAWTESGVNAAEFGFTIEA